MEVSRLKVVKVGGVAFIINFNMRISRHICDLRHAKHVMQACRELAFTFGIKFLWRVTYIKNKLMFFFCFGFQFNGHFFCFILFGKNVKESDFEIQPLQIFLCCICRVRVLNHTSFRLIYVWLNPSRLVKHLTPLWTVHSPLRAHKF